MAKDIISDLYGSGIIPESAVYIALLTELWLLLICDVL